MVRGRFAAAARTAAEASLDRVDELDGDTQTHTDLDVGVLALFSGVRIGVAVKHLTRPSFESGGDRIDLVRQARAGIALVSRGAGATGPVTLAADADLTRTPTAVGDVRHLAAGAEAWPVHRRVGLRGGVTFNTVDDARPSASAGLSLGVRQGVYVEGQATGGSDRTLRGWGFALRVTF